MPRITLRKGEETFTLEVRPRAQRGPLGPSIGGLVRYDRRAPIGRSRATVSRRFYVESRAEYEEAVRLLRADGYEEVD